jgi:hypothetical protein
MMTRRSHMLLSFSGTKMHRPAMWTTNMIVQTLQIYYKLLQQIIKNILKNTRAISNTTYSISSWQVTFFCNFLTTGQQQPTFHRDTTLSRHKTGTQAKSYLKLLLIRFLLLWTGIQFWFCLLIKRAAIVLKNLLSMGCRCCKSVVQHVQSTIDYHCEWVWSSTLPPKRLFLCKLYVKCSYAGKCQWKFSCKPSSVNS